MKCNWENIKVMSVCLGTKLKLSRKLLLAENYECLRLYNFSGRCTYVYENCRAIIERKQKPLYLDTKTFKQ